MTNADNSRGVPPVMDMYKEYRRVKNMNAATPETKANELCLRIGKVIKEHAGQGMVSITYDFGQVSHELHITISDRTEVLRRVKDTYIAAGYDISLEVQRQGQGSMQLKIQVQWSKPSLEARRQGVKP